MADAIMLLQQLGFGDYEARVYVTLLGQSPLSGYELARISGIPRPSIYPLIQKLEERGAIIRVETQQGNRYAPVPPDELLERLEQRVRTLVEAARRSLREQTRPPEFEYLWNIRGYPAMLEHATALLAAADQRLFVAVWRAEAEQLAEAFAEAAQRGIEITTLCLENCPDPCPACQGRIYRCRIMQQPSLRWFVLVQNEQEALAGEIAAQDEAFALRSRQHLFVELASWYIRHSIAITAILTDPGTRVEQQLSDETRALLALVGPGERGWLDHMQAIVQACQDA